MLVDPIRSSEPPQVQPAAAVRPDSAPPRVSDTFRAPTPAPVVKPVAPQPDTSDDIQVKWNADGVVVQITDKKSGELIRQIPSEQVLNVARFIDQLLQEERAAASTEQKTGSDRHYR